MKSRICICELGLVTGRKRRARRESWTSLPTSVPTHCYTKLPETSHL